VATGTEDLGGIQKHCRSRDGVRKVKTYLNLPRHLKGNEHFYRYTSSKRKVRKNVGFLLNGAGELVAKDIEKAKIFSAFLNSVCTGKTSFQESVISETSCLRPYLKTIAPKLVCKACCRTSWQASQIQTRQGINNCPKPALKGVGGQVPRCGICV